METNEASQDAAAALVHAAAAGDESAWSALVERFSPLVWEVARAHGLGAAAAAVVARVTWLRLAQHLDRLPEPERVGDWLEGTARQESLRESLRALALKRHDQAGGPGSPLRRTIG